MKWQPYHTVWAVLVTGWVGNYMVRVGIAPVLVPLIQEFQLSYTQAGLLATAFFYAYTFMQLPAGHLGDRLGRKVMLLLSTTCTATMSLLTAMAASFPALFVFRFFTGVAQGTYFVNDRPVIAAYTPKDQMGFGQGVSFIGLGIGMCLGVLLSGLIAERWGWRAVFFSFTLLPLLAATGIALLVREPPRTREAPGVRRPWGVIFRSRDLWLLNVGGIAALELHGRGAAVTAVSDVSGGLHSQHGLDVPSLLDYVREHGSLEGCDAGQRLSNDELLELDCDVLVLAAREDQISAENAPRVRARMIAEGANGPTSLEADEILCERGIPVLPDILTNAGGVTVSYFEWVQDLGRLFWTRDEIRAKLEAKLSDAFDRVWDLAEERRVTLRMGALVAGIREVSDALEARGIFP